MLALESLREGRAGNNSLCGIWFSRDGTILLVSACLTLERILGKEIPGKKQLLRQESSREPAGGWCDFKAGTCGSRWFRLEELRQGSRVHEFSD